MIASLRRRRLVTSAAAIAFLAGSVLIAAPAQADPTYLYPDDSDQSPVTISKTWSAPTVNNGGAVSATLTATHVDGIGHDIYIQDTYDFGLTPDLPLPAGCVTTSYVGYPMISCHVLVPAFANPAPVVVPFHAAYTGPKVYTKNWKTHERLTVQKVEKYVSLQGGDSGSYTLSCQSGYFLVDQSFHKLWVDQDMGTLEDIHMVSSNLTNSGWDVVIENDSGGQAQGKLFGACLKQNTNLSGQFLTIGSVTSSSVDNFLPVGPVASEFEATCPTGQTPVALNLKATPENSNYSNWQDDLVTPVGMKADGGRSATVFAIVHEPSDTTLQWRCLTTTSSSGYRMQFEVHHKTQWVAPGEEKEFSVSCQDDQKGIIGGWYGGPLNGSEPRPKIRTYFFRNLSAAWVNYEANLLCVENRMVRGGKIDKTVTQERCNYLGGVEDVSISEQAWLNRATACLNVKQN